MFSIGGVMENRSVPNFRGRVAWALLASLSACFLGSGLACAQVTITVAGTVNESIGSVKVNGIAATLAGNTFTATGVPLSLGPNTITATATDLAGNTASVSMTVHLGAKVNVKGTVDGSVTTVTVNGVTATLAPGTFSALVPMILGVNTVTATAQDAAGNTATATGRVFVARPPVNHP